jgi:hypothetical protein
MEKMDEVLELVRLFFMFGVNEKFNLITTFYLPSTISSQMGAM